MAADLLGPAKAGRKPIASPGERYGRLVVIGFVKNVVTKGGGQIRPVYRFRCDCGREADLRIYSVRSGKTLSCGCRAHISRPRHGACVGGRLSPEWRAWRDMLTRATNPNINHAHRYTGRGITVAAEWGYGGDGKGFERFRAHVGPKPSPQHSLDRIDNDGNYEPGNVRWATRQEQIANRSTARTIEINGFAVPLMAAAERAGIKASIIMQRIDKLGWPPDLAVTKPPRPDKRRAA
jgi:hypothetical protein